MPLQRVIAKEIFNYPPYVIAELPQFPLMSFLSCLLRAGCIGLLIICCGNKKGGIWLEILIIVILAIVILACLTFILLKDPIIISIMLLYIALSIALRIEILKHKTNLYKLLLALEKEE
jgi:hypothetical protein